MLDLYYTEKLLGLHDPRAIPTPPTASAVAHSHLRGGGRPAEVEYCKASQQK